ncbi:LacI family DNA-binding transcriptional regulator [Streptomyces sp. MP131-18]|uniref:LacI family DNA-binding transcriptional regulator n=1 Tax=Streptomyces sp. MP131-18 TaxID=1857892 RepID=UPI0009C59529|nr:LacI family DNA-binding transcriptional regulator [Streptomyces sp. MP131-18]ONK09747.1 Arabinose metabolism transcriptional repressor [Streptomyces sp. MP131-18]
MADMLVAQRHELLVRELEASGVLKITELATRLGVSRATIRRDLVDLETEGRVTRVRGGALLAAPTTLQAPTAPVPQGSGHTLGLLVPSATYYYPRVIAGVRAAAAERGARVIIGLTDYAQPRDHEQIAELTAAGATGLLIVSTGGHHLPPTTLDHLTTAGLPYVLLERQPQNPYVACEYVISDHQQGAYNAVRHLAELGHQRIALFTNGSPTAPLVTQGHAQAVHQLGLDPAAPTTDSGRPTLGSAEATTHYDHFINACRTTHTRAALIHSDHDAIEIMRRARTHRLRIPDDLALIAYDDEIASLAEVPLTAVAPHKHELGVHAAHLLLDRLTHPRPDSLPIRQLTLQPRLIVRTSSGSPAPA